MEKDKKKKYLKWIAFYPTGYRFQFLLGENAAAG